jgi:hypothetical protein
VEDGTRSIPTLASSSNPFISKGLIGVRVESSTKSSTILALVHYPAQARRGHADCPDARQNQTSYPYQMRMQDMDATLSEIQTRLGHVVCGSRLVEGERLRTLANRI